MSEIADKLSRLRSWMKTRTKLDGVVLSDRSSFAWLTGGGDSHVVAQSEQGCAALVVTARSAYLLVDAIEAPRLRREEPVKLFTIKERPWTQPLAEALAKLRAGKRWAADDASGTGLPALPDHWRELRWQLCDEELRRYRALGRDCSLAIETVAMQMSIGDSGYQVEADLARHLLARGIQPHLLLVAFDDRLKAYRHPTPCPNHLKHHAMLVVCGKRHGLIANLTRCLHFGPIPNDILARHHAAGRIEAALWAATKPGATWGQALAAGLAQYKAEGYAKEWQLHHQGGPTGYAGREFKVIPEDKRLILDRQAVAWNPSISGAKSEDTFVLNGTLAEGADGTAVHREIITEATARWPMLELPLPGGGSLRRPGILVR